jgi:hypothetical protein
MGIRPPDNLFGTTDSLLTSPLTSGLRTPPLNLFGLALDPLEALQEEEEKRQKLWRDNIINNRLKFKRGTIQAAMADLTLDVGQDIKSVIDEPERLLQGIGTGVQGFAASLLHPLETGKALLKGIVYDGLIKPFIINPIKTTFDPNLSDEENEQLLKETAVNAFGWLVGAGAAKAFKIFGGADEALKLAKSPNYKTLLNSMDEKKLAAVAAETFNQSTLRGSLKGAAAFSLGATPIGFLEGSTPEERFGNAFATGLTGAVLGGVMGGVGTRIRNTKLNSPKVLDIKAEAAKLFEAKQVPFVLERFPNPQNALTVAVEALGTEGIAKSIANSVGLDEVILIRNIPEVTGKVPDVKNVIYHTTPKGEKIGLAIGDGVGLTEKQTKAFKSTGHYPGEVVYYSGRRYIIANDTARPITSKSARLIDPENGLALRNRVALDKLDYSPNFERVTGVDLEGKASFKSGGIKDFMDIGIPVDEASHIIRTMINAEKLYEAQTTDVVARARNAGILAKANKEGTITLIDAESNIEVGKVNSLKELNSAVNSFGGVVGKELITFADILNRPIDPANLPVATGRGVKPNKYQLKLARFGFRHPKLTEAGQWSADVEVGTGGKVPARTQIWIPWQEKLRIAKNQTKGLVDNYNKVSDEFHLLNREEQFGVVEYLESATPDELKGNNPKTRAFVDRNMTPDEISFGERIAEQIDEGVTGLNKAVNTLGEAATLLDETPDIGVDAAIAEAAKIFSPTESQLRLTRSLYDLVYGGNDLGDLSGYGVLRLAYSILRKEKSKSELVKNLSPKQIKAMESVQGFLRDDAVPAFGIEKPQILNHYFPMVVESNPLAPMRPIPRHLAGRAPENLAFVHAMTRVGYGLTDGSSTLPVEALSKYTYRGIHKKYIAPELNRITKLINDLATSENFASEKSNGIEGAKRFRSVMGEAINESLHWATEETKVARETLDLFNKQLGIDVKTQDYGNFVTRFTALSSYSLLGYSYLQGVRDLTSGLMWYYSNLGLKATKDMIKLGAKSGDRIEARLRAAGKVPQQLNRILTADAVDAELVVPGWRKGADKFVKAGGENAFSLTLQRQAYEFLHRAAVLERMSTVSKAEKSFRVHKNRVRFEKDIGLGSYSPADVQKFNSLFDSGNTNAAKDAANHLAHATAQDFIGVYGTGNHPIGWSASWGRMAGQFGKWPLWALRQVANRSVGPNGKQFVARVAAATTAMGVAGWTTGVNLSGWTFLPQNLIFMGGPGIQAAMDGLSAVQGNDPQRQSFGITRLKNLSPVRFPDGELKITPRQFYIPVPYMMWNMMEGLGVTSDPNSPVKTTSETTYEAMLDDPRLAGLRIAGFSIAPWDEYGIPFNQRALDRGTWLTKLLDY